MLQLDQPPDESKAQRVERVVALLSDGPETDVVVLPELWDVGYFRFDCYAQDAQELTGPVVAALADVARRRGIVLVGGSLLERRGKALHNTTVVLGPDGTLLGCYRKHHLFGYHSREAELLVPGCGPVVVPTPVGRLGLATCFDLRFPAHFATLRADDADVFIVPAAWPAARIEHFRVLCRARAIETQTPLAAVNGTGLMEGVEVGGSSCVVDAQGAVVKQAGIEPGWAVAALDPAATDAWRREFPLDTHVVVGLP